MVLFRLRQFALACSLVAVPGALFAQTGIVFIDQVSAQRGEITPGDDPGFPVTISQSGSYQLRGNLVVPPNTPAIQITADFVTLDLAGFSIIGPGACVGGPATICPAIGQGAGIQAGGDSIQVPRGIRVRNGAVRGMGGVGVHLPGIGSFAEKISADGNAGGGISVAGGVFESSATRNGAFGIIGGMVRDSSATENLGDGILLDSSNGGVASGNTSSLNGGFGIYVPRGSATGNSAFLNKSFGISAVCPASLIGNTVVGNDNAGGIDIKGTGCSVLNNASRP